jgi:hypothetical protein
MPNGIKKNTRGRGGRIMDYFLWGVYFAAGFALFFYIAVEIENKVREIKRKKRKPEDIAEEERLNEERLNEERLNEERQKEFEKLPKYKTIYRS